MIRTDRLSPSVALATLFIFTGSFSIASDTLAAPAPLGLSDLFRNTVDTSDLVRTKLSEKESVEAIHDQGIGALLPQISGTATYFKTQLPSTFVNLSNGGSGGFAGNQDTQKTIRLTGKQYIFKGGQEYAFLSKTNRLLEAKDAEVAASRQRYFFDLANAYYDTLLKQAEVSHFAMELKLYDEQITELRSRVKIGRSRSTDLLTAQASRAGSEGTLRSAQSAFNTSKIFLANLARTATDIEIREETPFTSPLAPLDEYLKLSSQRPDLIAARKSRDAASEEVSYQRNGHFPTVDLAGNYYVARKGVANDAKWDATLTLTLPIFSGGTTEAAVRQAAASMQTTEIETGRLERTAENDIRALYQSLLASDTELKAFFAAVDLAQKSYDQTRKDYRYGLTTNLDLLNSLKTLTDAKRSYDRAKYRRFLERIQIEIGAGHIPKTSVSST